jgi:hypothetical protein
VSLLGGESPFRHDDGRPDPGVTAALAAFAAGHGSEHAALTALASSRLLVPVVAAESQGADDHGAEISLPTLMGRDGRPAIPAFTSLEALARWRGEARPVPAQASLVWRAAVDDACAVVVDIAGPVPLPVDGARLAALAAGRPVPRPHEDPDVLAAVRAAVAGQPAITGLRLAPGDGADLGGTTPPDPPGASGESPPSAAAPAAAGGGPGADDRSAGDHAGCDLQIQVTLAAACDPAAGEEAVRQLGSSLLAQLGGRLRRGIALAVTSPAGHRGG